MSTDPSQIIGQSPEVEVRITAVVERDFKRRDVFPKLRSEHALRIIGGAIAAAATRVKKPDGLILESTFPDKAAIIRRQPILRALNLFATYRFPTLEWLRGFDRPVLVMHGERDSIIPFRLGEELFAKLDSPKTFIALRGADHNDSFDASNREYWDSVMTFIRGLPPRNSAF